jgi:hypothetical protein
MKIRSSEELYEYLSNEISWRKKEISDFKVVIEANRDSRRLNTLLRGSVAILYAHWEGFVKNAAECYMVFVTNQEKTHSQLEDNFLALSLRKKFKLTQEDKRVSKYVEIVDFFKNSLSEENDVNFSSMISTESNLNSNVLKEIMESLGVDYTEFSTKNKLIDEKLLKNRNYIAHGKEQYITYEEYIELNAEVLLMLDQFKTQIENSTALKKYLKITT